MALSKFGIAYDQWKNFLNDNTLWTIAGYAALGYLSLSWCKQCVWAPFKLYVLAQLMPGVDLRECGQWAIITGASQGVGFAFSNALAKKGMNLVLIDLPDERLNKAKNRIEESNNVKVKTVGLDFKDPTVYEKISTEIEGLDIGVLINNVGICLDAAPVHQLDNTLEAHKNYIFVNCLPMTEMSLLVLPQMVKRNKGVIVNMTSCLWRGAPLVAGYSSTKAYVTIMSQCMSKTYSKIAPGILIQSLEPGMIDTPMLEDVFRDVKLFSLLGIYRLLFMVSPESFVRTSLNTVGWANMCNGHYRHFLQDSGWIASLFLSLFSP